MPRDTANSPANRRREGTSERRRSAPSARATRTASASDPSQWRSSKLKDTDTITRTEVDKRYRLKHGKGDLEGISFRTEQTVAPGGFLTSMYIYQERDIERRAWEKHGGPEAFDEHLAKLRARYVKKNGADATAFPQPKTYEDPGGRPPLDTFVGKSTTLSDIKDKMAPWLWKAFNIALLDIDGAEIVAKGPRAGFFRKDADRERSMSMAMAMATTYPARPDQKLPSSESVDRVRAVLAEAATAPQIDIMDCEDDYILGELLRESEWSEDFLERLFTALIQLINEHGLGSEGLEGIRWEVYDKYVKCMRQGPKYDRLEGRWRDLAAEWLDAQFTKVGIQWDGSCREKCPAGRRFNDMLPLRNPSGVRSVGW